MTALTAETVELLQQLIRYAGTRRTLHMLARHRIPMSTVQSRPSVAAIVIVDG